MKAYVKLAGATAGIALMALAPTAPAAGAVIEQTRTVDYFDILTSRPGFATKTTTQDLLFDSFDPTLGVLTGVTWSLTSSRDYEIAASYFGVGLTTVFFYAMSTRVLLGNLVLGSADVGSETPFSCAAIGVPFCVETQTTQDDFDFTTEAENLTPYLAPGGVIATLQSVMAFNGFDQTFIDLIQSGIASSIDWDGELRLTYIYEPTAGIPEPAAWALMIVGFGLSGGALRRRRPRPGALDDNVPT